MLFRFEIGRKLAGSEEGSPGFFENRCNLSHFEHSGKTPCEKDRLARLDMSSEKTPEQDLRREVGMKSRGEDFAGMDLRITRTSSGDTGEGASRVDPV